MKALTTQWPVIIRPSAAIPQVTAKESKQGLSICIEPKSQNPSVSTLSPVVPRISVVNEKPQKSAGVLILLQAEQTNRARSSGFGIH